MRLSNKTYTITEYGGFIRGASLSGYQSLPERTFAALETFILANTAGAETEAIELLSLSARRGIGKIITIYTNQNIQLKNMMRMKMAIDVEMNFIPIPKRTSPLHIQCWT